MAAPLWKCRCSGQPGPGPRPGTLGRGSLRKQGPLLSPTSRARPKLQAPCGRPRARRPHPGSHMCSVEVAGVTPLLAHGPQAPAARAVLLQQGDQRAARGGGQHWPLGVPPFTDEAPGSRGTCPEAPSEDLNLGQWTSKSVSSPPLACLPCRPATPHFIRRPLQLYLLFFQLKKNECLVKTGFLSFR